uniref:Uncharacterized protein n=1 Tax=Melopsittacus undulatus TaxID=13146 RepID=A0A8V5G3Q4_MELUD
MGSWAAATWRLGGCRGRGGLRAVPRRRGSSRPGGGHRAATLSDLLQSSVGGEEPDAAAAARQERRSPREGTVLLFPGQGSQWVGMGRGLLRYPGVRDMYSLAEKVLGYDLLSLCLEGPQDELDRTRHCQPAVFVASLAAVEKLNHQRPERCTRSKCAPKPCKRRRKPSPAECSPLSVGERQITNLPAWKPVNTASLWGYKTPCVRYQTICFQTAESLQDTYRLWSFCRRMPENTILHVQKCFRSVGLFIPDLWNQRQSHWPKP